MNLFSSHFLRFEDRRLHLPLFSFGDIYFFPGFCMWECTVHYCNQASTFLTNCLRALPLKNKDKEKKRV